MRLDMGPQLQEIRQEKRRETAVSMLSLWQNEGKESAPVPIRYAPMETGPTNERGNYQMQEMRGNEVNIIQGQYWIIGPDRGKEWCISNTQNHQTMFVSQEAMDELVALFRSQE
jgi:hypothetical protein